MAELNALMKEREELLVKIHHIEHDYEGLENEDNAKRSIELNMQKTELLEKEKSLTSQLAFLKTQIQTVEDEINILAEKGIDKILKAIEGQRFYFFENKKQVVFDSYTGLLWANLNYFPWKPSEDENSKYESNKDKAIEVIRNYDFDNEDSCIIDSIYYSLLSLRNKWELPHNTQIHKLRYTDFPFIRSKKYEIFDKPYWFISNGSGIGLNYDTAGYINERADYLLPCNDILRQKYSFFTEQNYQGNYSKYSFAILQLFTENKLLPKFADDKVAEIYKEIYFDKADLVEKLRKLIPIIEEMQEVIPISSTFDYREMLSVYDIDEIDHSVIKYYEAVQNWIDGLIRKIEAYEQQKEEIIRDFNIIGLKLSKKYEENDNLTEEENALMEQRQRYFQRNLALGMNSVKTKLLAVKKQADDLEDRIDEIDNGTDSIRELALLEQEERASFSFIAENTAKIVRNALLKIEFFETHHQYVMDAIDIWETWTADYLVFKTACKELLKGTCEDDGIEENVWSGWYSDWQKLRFAIEQKVQPLVEYGLKRDIETFEPDGEGVIQKLVSTLKQYKDAVDTFYKEERKSIYQKYAFQSGGELQDKFDTEGTLYRYTAQFQAALQEIIFSCKNAEDRIFILNWANDLLDIQIDEILVFVADNDLQKISEEILGEFAALKQKNFDTYLTDARAYGEERARREKEYNSLVFKMRKDLMAR